jgi:hypothetical protein
LKTSNLILDFEFDQHLESHKHVINIIMWFRDMGCYTALLKETKNWRPLVVHSVMGSLIFLESHPKLSYSGR